MILPLQAKAFWKISPMIALQWTFGVAILGYVLFLQKKAPISQAGLRIRRAFSQDPVAPRSLHLLFFIAVLFWPLVAGMDLWARTDANVIVVLVFFAWAYQWIKFVWNSQPESDAK